MHLIVPIAENAGADAAAVEELGNKNFPTACIGLPVGGKIRADKSKEINAC
jgi:hypothetical protein